MIRTSSFARKQKHDSSQVTDREIGPGVGMTEDLPQYGYTCSMCQSVDIFNQESLLYNPPVDSIRRALTKMYAENEAHPDDVIERRQAMVRHPIPCNRKLRHRHGTCSAQKQANCTTAQHWRLCSGFYSVALLVKFSVSGLDQGGGRVNYYRDIELVDILPAEEGSDGGAHAPEDLGRGYYSLPRRLSSQEIRRDVTEIIRPDPLSLPELQDQWLRLKDAIFSTDLSYWKLHYFCFLTDARRRLKVTDTKVIQPEPKAHAQNVVGTFRKSALASVKPSLPSIPLACYLDNGRLPEHAHRQTRSERLRLHSNQLLQTLISQPRSDPRLYFNSCHVCKGQLGTEEHHVTLALVTEQDGRDAVCRRRMLELDLKENPVLQIDADTGLVKVMESLEKSKRRFWVDLHVFSPIYLEEFGKLKWESLNVA